jgi:hypothetical protein
MRQHLGTVPLMRLFRLLSGSKSSYSITAASDPAHVVNVVKSYARDFFCWLLHGVRSKAQIDYKEALKWASLWSIVEASSTPLSGVLCASACS